LAIVGAGSSGLVTLKHALDGLPGWEITCFEKSSRTIGVWGNPYPGFASTSTKYTTQFSCFRKWNTEIDPAQRPAKGDFFRGDEYGLYLEEFVRRYALAPHIRLHTAITRIVKAPGGWRLSINDGAPREETFDRLIVCTGLTAEAKTIDTEIRCLRSFDDPVENKTIVVFGGGESAADVAHRLARPSLGNTVYLSLKNGIRVSPRYHPIRGVPSDFLRNRLLLSIRQDIRNSIGQKFVEARIRHQERFEKFFKSPPPTSLSSSAVEKRKHWDAKLTARAKDELFNTFHTKSDDFLDDVAEDRIRIIGPPADETYRRYTDFDGASILDLQPDALCPMIGYRPSFAAMFDSSIHVRDFHLGCLHTVHDDLFLIGHARPIIGNIPTISEMQARFVVSVISGKTPRPPDIAALHASERRRLETDFPQLNFTSIHPVEMFTYCDHLARMMGTYPTLRKTGSLKRWLKIQTSPASTAHYLDADFSPAETDALKIHCPALIVFLLVIVKALEPFFGRQRPLSERGWSTIPLP
jgi:hypothetical protein